MQLGDPNNSHLLMAVAGVSGVLLSLVSIGDQVRVSGELILEFTKKMMEQCRQLGSSRAITSPRV